MISSKQLGQALYHLINENTHSIDVVSDAFVEYVKTHKLESLVPRVLEYLEIALKKDAAFNTLEISSGLPIDKKISEKIVEILKAPANAKTKIKVDSELIGGFVASFRGFEYDASIKNQLKHLHTKLLTIN